MAVAWSTVVVLVLLLPGVAFFTGFYFPQTITRESVPLSPLSQLAGIVAIAFFLHAISFGVTNSLCLSSRYVSCIAIDRLMPILKADSVTSGTAIRDLADIQEMLNANISRIITYFAVLMAVGTLLGYGVGTLIATGPLRFMTRNPWMYPLVDGIRDKTRTNLVRAHVLSKTANEGQVVIYQGTLVNFYAKLDGSIANLVLADAYVGGVMIQDAVPPARLQKLRPLATNPGEPDQFFVISADNIANVYFERIPSLQTSAADVEELDREVAKLQQGEAVLRGN